MDKQVSKGFQESKEINKETPRKIFSDSIQSNLSECNYKDDSHILENINHCRFNRVQDLMEKFSQRTDKLSNDTKAGFRMIFEDSSDVKVTFLNKIDHFKSIEKRSNDQIVQNCKPSEIKDFHKEKLEKIIKNKLNDQKFTIKNPQNTFLNFDFKKNLKTGEYESSECQNLSKSYGPLNLTYKSSKIKDLISKFENQNGSEK